MLNDHVASVIKEGIPQLQTYPQVTQLCQRAMTTLQSLAQDRWVFTRYMRRVDFTVCGGILRGFDLNRHNDHRGKRIAVGVAAFDVSRPGFVFAGGAVCNPEDRWNRHIGRVVATLRMVCVPLNLACLWAIDRAPWDYDWPIHGKRLEHLEYPWNSLSDYIPPLSRPAVVDVVRQALRHKMFGCSRINTLITLNANSYLSISAPSALLVNTEISNQLVDKAGQLPMYLPKPRERHEEEPPTLDKIKTA